MPYAIIAILSMLLIGSSVLIQTSRAESCDVKTEVSWAAFSPTHAVIEYHIHLDPYAELANEAMIKQGFYFAIECPISSVSLVDHNSEGIPAEEITQCNRITETHFEVRHFFKGDFALHAPKGLSIVLGQKPIHPSGEGAPILSKDFGKIAIFPDFLKQDKLVLSSQNPAQVDTLAIKSAEIIFSPGKSLVEACLSLPDASDWKPLASILVDGKAHPAIPIELLDYKNPMVYAGRDRCYRFTVEGLSEMTEMLQKHAVSFRLDGVELNIPECFSPDLWDRISEEIDFSDLSLSKDSADYVCPMGEIAKLNNEARATELHQWLKPNLTMVSANNLIVPLD